MNGPLIVSLAALLIAIASFTWQVVSWRKTGSVVAIEGDIRSLSGGMLPYHGVAVTATNNGRISAVVTEFGLASVGLTRFTQVESYIIDTPLPAHVPASGEVEFFFSVEEITSWVRENNLDFRQIRPYAKVGGKIIRGRFDRDTQSKFALGY